MVTLVADKLNRRIIYCIYTLLKMGCYITPLGHYTILVIEKLQRVVLITGMA